MDTFSIYNINKNNKKTNKSKCIHGLTIGYGGGASIKINEEQESIILELLS
ncbi:hypothetical protein B0P06_002858 [Clostridium saccharoperbutylacetonicum]|uniref:hypothetical protein n=1 Tax=Clostridium saccharoperbutylacetonicum TaxID=36745 RepID=UPI00034BE412|nr:hypothetical protein [Clostridium saccharoperbutylacetonicum]NSB43087.1 hypothetical protein [Clostridium saccharoperbutylacetonicum]